MAMVHDLAAFVTRARWASLSEAARAQLKARILDALGCAIGALGGELTGPLRALTRELSPAGPCSLVGGGTAAPDRAALFNGALVRYLDFNDSYLAPGETCHPSDNLGAVLAAAEHADAPGEELLVAVAVAYQVQCRLSDVAPVRQRGFDHTTQGAFAAAAGAARALGLDEAHTANAVAIAGTALPALRVTRTGALSHWKGLAAPFTGFAAFNAVLLARHGVTGPAEVFEGTKGFMESVAGRFELDWSREDLERVTRTDVKRFNAEFHSQSALEALLDLRSRARLDPAKVDRVDLETFQVAYDIIGGGEEGAKKTVRTKEEADHSLPYLLAVALLDGQVMPGQYSPHRIRRADVQALLQRVSVRPAADLSARFPREMPCRLRVRLASGEVLLAERNDYAGFHTRPVSWDDVRRKFDALAAPFTGRVLRGAIGETVQRLERVRVRELTALLQQVGERKE